MKIWTEANSGLVIFDKFDNLKFFADTASLTEASASVSAKNATVKGSTVHFYMNSKATHTRAATVKEFIVDPGRRKGAALPGWNFVLGADLGVPGEEIREFTAKGTIMDLHTFLTGAAKMAITLWGPTGARYSTIPGNTP